jgi:hypothetical protein
VEQLLSKEKAKETSGSTLGERRRRPASKDEERNKWIRTWE